MLGLHHPTEILLAHFFANIHLIEKPFILLDYIIFCFIFNPDIRQFNIMSVDSSCLTRLYGLVIVVLDLYFLVSYLQVLYYQIIGFLR